MKCTLHRQTLITASERLVNFVNRKPITAILGCYLLHFTKNRLDLAVHEGSHQIQTFCDANCQEEDLRLCIPARAFHNIIDSFVDPEIKLSIKGTGANGSLQKLVVVSGKSRHELPISDPLLFPVIKKPEGKHVLKADATSILSMWDNISQLINEKDSSTPQMAGINILTHELIPGSIVMCGGTTFRCAMASMPVSVGAWKPVVIHCDLTSRAKEVFNQGLSTLTIAHDGGNVIITDGASTVLTRTLDGKWPNIVGLIKNLSEKNKHNFKFSIGEISDAIKRLLYHKTETYETLEMVISDTGMELNFDNNETGTEGNEGIAISGNPTAMTLGLNIMKLNDCVKCCNSQSAEFSYNRPDHAFIIMPIDQITSGYSLSIMLAPVYLG